MKVLCINGSPRKTGSSAFIIDKILAGLDKRDITVRKYCLGEMSIGFCIGCKYCYDTGRCIQIDDMDVIIEDLIEADLVIIASPSYWGDVTGQLKVFFDRNTPYSDTNPNTNKIRIPQGKKGVSIAIRAGQSDRENLHIIESIEHYFGHLGIQPVASLSIKGVNTINDLMTKEEEINKAYELGRSIAKRFPE